VRIVDVEEWHGNFFDSARTLEVEYNNGERVCLGRWSLDSFLLEGHVHQQVQINTRGFHLSNSGMHTFLLTEGRMDLAALLRGLEVMVVNNLDGAHTLLSPVKWVCSCMTCGPLPTISVGPRMPSWKLSVAATNYLSK
jgi:hypothetical protein